MRKRSTCWAFERPLVAAGSAEEGDGEERDEPDGRDREHEDEQGGDEQRAAADECIGEDLEDGLDEPDQDADDRQWRLRLGENGILAASLAYGWALGVFGALRAKCKCKYRGSSLRSE